MQTIILNEPGRFSMTDTPAPPAPGPGEALVRVHRVGICGTDLHAFEGKQPFFSYPRILGHELGVAVVAVGDGVSHVQPGDCCAVEPYLNCGKCVACRRGRTNCCQTLQCLGVHTDGGMRERIIVPAHKLHPSNQLSLEQLALVETLGIGCHAVNRTRIEPDENVLVIGAGPIGLGVMCFASAAGGRVVALDVNEQRLAFCRRHSGVEQALTLSDNVVDDLRRAFAGELPTAVLDATGNPKSMHAAFDYVAPSGRLTFVGLFIGDVTFHDPDFHRKELTLLATRNATPADFRQIIAMTEAGQIDTQPWITHRVAAAGMIQQFPTWLDPAGGCIKGIVNFAE